MKPLDLLRAHWSIWGLDAPKFAWIAAAFLLMAPLLVPVFLWWKVRRESKVLSLASARVRRLRAGTPYDPRAGLSTPMYNDLSDILSKFPSLSQAWNGYASLVVVRRGPTGEDQFWASESAECTFTDSAVLETRLNRGFYSSLPSIVTGTGLLFTFLAILVALLDVRINPQTNQIEGLSLLIEGLSGKFASSIAALFSATIFLLAEKPLAHRLSTARLRLISSMDALVPRLSSARVLADIQRDIAEQMILRDALWMVCAGLAVGIPLALWASTVAASFIHGLPAKSPVYISFGAAAMIAVGLVSAYIPARRAVRVDPMVALRYE
jgi:hypothetical protein